MTMVALDTNVLVRYLVWDDDDQARRAEALIDGAVARGEKMYVSQVVLCEVAWVLERAYSFGRDELDSALDGIVRAAQLDVEQPEVASRALHRFRAGSAGFADYLIAESARQAGYETVATFDGKLLRESGFLEP